MSELMNASSGRKGFRWQLLSSVSALALLCAIHGSAKADDDGDHPAVWIELGGQLEQLNAGEEQFVPSFILATPRPVPETISPLSVGHPPRFSIGGEGKISFEPEDTRWVFSAAIRYGRSNDSKQLRQQSPNPTQALDQTLISRYPGQVAPIFRKALEFIDTKQLNRESHAILDFQAGKDVGLGMFGTSGASALSLGVRFAQFGSATNVAFKSDPDAHPTFLTYGALKFPRGGIYHSNAATADINRSFRGLGPSISWNAFAPVAGNTKDGEIVLDWGVNAALLFGRQKAHVHHQTTGRYHKGKYNVYNPPMTIHSSNPPDHIRSRTATVPDIGGFAGMSYRFINAKLSIGYRADFFFGAMDGGIDAAKKENRGFYGPFASVSIGLGG